MKTIRINFCDFFGKFNKEDNTITNILKEKYHVIISETPDYIFYSTFGQEYINYDCIKIFFTGECIVPDFNLCDYAIGFDYIDFNDRYIRVPLYQLFHYSNKFENLINGDIKRVPKTDFCSFVVSNDQGSINRFQMFKLLNEYKTVDSGGRYLNNIGGPVVDKLEFDRKHKFSICFENCSHSGYTTEKIMEAFAADTIPIYWGNPLIGLEFNTKAFINVLDYHSLVDVVKKVIEIDNDVNLYNKIKSEPIFNESVSRINELRKFLFNIFEQPLDSARRRPYNTYIKKSELQVKVYDRYHRVLGKYISKIKAGIRRYKNNAL